MDANFKLTHLTRDPVWIEAADAAGVERIGIDIERIGKVERQAADPNARISDHHLIDLRVVAAHVRKAKPFARLNRPYAKTAEEVELALGFGAASLMLPGFRTAAEVARFVAMVRGRAEVILLVETHAAALCLDEILAVTGVDEVMVGLNDMSLELGLGSPMEVAASELLENVARRVIAAGLSFGFGGVAQPGRRDLPVNPDLLLARYAQLGANCAWIARSFYNNGLRPEDFAGAIATLRARIAAWRALPEAELDTAVERFRKLVTRSVEVVA